MLWYYIGYIKDKQMSDKDLLQKAYNLIGNILKGSSKESTPEVIKSLNTEEQKCIEVVYAPNVKDAHGEWMEASTILRGQKSFSKNEVGSNLFHLVETDKFSITKSWIVEEDSDYETPDGVKTVAKGTWLAETHYTDPALWEMKKSGELGGLSLGGYGSVNEETGEIINLCFSKDEYQQLLGETV